MIFLDFETLSTVPLTTRGAYVYAQSSDTDVICLAFTDTDSDAAAQHWLPGDPVPATIATAAASGTIFAASNAAFDRLIYSTVCVRKYGFPAVPIERWTCTQAQSRVCGLPSSLRHLAVAIGLPLKKSSRGDALIRKMCVPPFEHTPELLAEMQKYCERDCIVTVLGAAKLPELSARLHEDYVVNERVNDRGFCIDRELALAATDYVEREQTECSARLIELTDGRVQKHTQAKRFRDWIVEQLTDHPALAVLTVVRDGVEKFSVDKTARGNLINSDLHVPEHVIEALNCYDIASGTATAKYKRLLGLCGNDGRVRGVLRAFGAPSTLRYSSLGVQVHNLYRNTFEQQHVETVREAVITKKPLIDPATSKPISVTTALSKLLRSTIVAAPGHVFVSADWSAIESRTTAWISGDNDKLAVFLRGECPYCYAAEQIFSRKITPHADPEARQIGKISDLACGFLGGVGALHSMSTQLSVVLDNPQKLVDSWRARHPKIVAFGNALAAGALRAVRRPSVPQRVGSVGYLFDGENLQVLLSDRDTVLTYPQARLEYNADRRQTEITALKAARLKRQDDTEWPRHSLWRGLLLENVVQAACAILLRDLVYAFQHVCVLHVHDEIVLEIPEAQADAYRVELERVMRKSPQWAQGLPLVATAKITKRFGK